MEALLLNNGIELVERAEDADLDFYVGQPPLNLRPSMHPAITLSMFETTVLPTLWVNSFNNWDAVINPSDWGCECFRANGIIVPIYKVPLPINFDKFRYVERNLESDWIYLTQGVQLLDRKNVLLVAELFEDNKMPEDTRLIVKTIPRTGQPEFDVSLSEGIELIQTHLDFDDYYERILSKSHVSVNPSSGEGFSYLPAESMATGLCTIMTNFSAMTNLLENDCTLGIDCKITPTNVFVTGGLDADIDIEDMHKKMLWTYEHREEAMKMGRASARWIREYCNPDKIFNSIIEIFERCIEQTPKLILPTVKIEELIDFDSLRIGMR
jgi:glycosyltransferase involved in cell wall biosynthesis